MLARGGSNKEQRIIMIRVWSANNIDTEQTRTKPGDWIRMRVKDLRPVWNSPALTGELYHVNYMLSFLKSFLILQYQYMSFDLTGHC